MGGGWWRLAVWRLVAVGGGWRLVVLGGRPEGLFVIKKKLGLLRTALPPPPPPLCDIPLGCCFFTGPWTVTRSSLRMLHRVTAFCRPLRPVLPLVSFPRSRSPVVGVLGLC